MSEMKTIHMCIDIRGMLDRPKSFLRGMFANDDGSKCTPEEARDYLYDCLAEGKKVLPVGSCDNFDFQKGCLGHINQPPTSAGQG